MRRSLPLPVFPPASSDGGKNAPDPLIPSRGRHSLGRIQLKRIAVRRTPPADTPRAQPCDLTAWSSGLYGVFLPDRRKQQVDIVFSDRRAHAA